MCTSCPGGTRQRSGGMTSGYVTRIRTRRSRSRRRRQEPGVFAHANIPRGALENNETDRAIHSSVGGTRLAKSRWARHVCMRGAVRDEYSAWYSQTLRRRCARERASTALYCMRGAHLERERGQASTACSIRDGYIHTRTRRPSAGAESAGEGGLRGGDAGQKMGEAWIECERGMH